MNTHKQTKKDVKITIDNYDFHICWNYHSQSYEILHDNGLTDKNGDKIGFVRFGKQYQYPTLNKVKMDLRYFVDNKKTYILKLNK